VKILPKRPSSLVSGVRPTGRPSPIGPPKRKRIRGVRVCGRGHDRLGRAEIASFPFETGEIDIEFERGLFRVAGADRELEPGVRHIEMAANPDRVWRAIQGARAGDERLMRGMRAQHNKGSCTKFVLYEILILTN
jgi:hypothetical protein